EVDHDGEPHPRLRELPHRIAEAEHGEPEQEHRVDEVLTDLRDEEVGLIDADRLVDAPRLHAHLHLLPVDPVEKDRAEADDGEEDVQHQHELVETAIDRGQHHVQPPGWRTGAWYASGRVVARMWYNARRARAGGELLGRIPGPAGCAPAGGAAPH